MATKYTVRNQDTGHVYIKDAKSFTMAVKTSESIINEPIEMIKTTTEVIRKYETNKP